MAEAGIVLISCGCFSPPTPMHLRMFEIARDYLQQIEGRQVIGGIVSPVHDSYRKTGLLPIKHRCKMLKLALGTSDWIKLSEWECSQKLWTKTLTSIQYHQNFINNYLNSLDTTDNLPDWVPFQCVKKSLKNVKVTLLCGADLLESFNIKGMWVKAEIEELLCNHGLVVISRYGICPEKFIFESDLLTKHRKNITLITNWVCNEISSSVIRRLINRNQSVKYLMDDSVLEYIRNHGLLRKELRISWADSNGKICKKRLESDLQMDINGTDEIDHRIIDISTEESHKLCSFRAYFDKKINSQEYAFSDFLRDALKTNRLRVSKKEEVVV